MKASSRAGFTVVELVIVIIVIAILTAVVVVGYRGAVAETAEKSMKSDLQGTVAALENYKNFNNEYPTTLSSTERVQSGGNVIVYTKWSNGFCVEVTSDKSDKKFYRSTSGDGDGECPAAPPDPSEPPTPLPPVAYGDFMQTITTDRCPTVRIMAVDARDNRTYWVQKLADGRCWMLTNLAYAGGVSNGGVSTYGDTKALQNGTSDASATYTLPKYYVSSNANPTLNPIEPSSNTEGGGSERQYGYHYNWCAAMGAQVTTSSCSNALSPLYDSSISVCPSGWRIPTGVATTGELELLTNSISATSNSAGHANLRSVWLAQHAGIRNDIFYDMGSFGYAWSSSQQDASRARALGFFIYAGTTSVGLGNQSKMLGLSVRCIAI